MRQSPRRAAVSAAAAVTIVLGVVAPSAEATAATITSTASAGTAAAPTVYVAPTGSDHNPGTASAPFATVQHAVDTVHAGGTVLLRGGVYAQRVVLQNATGVTVAPAAGEHAVLDGTRLAVPAGRSAMVTIAGSTRVTVQGLDITGYRTSDIAAMPIGVYVHGSDTTVRISGNHVHDLGNFNATQGSLDINAHGIAVYGDSVAAPVHDLTIDGNEVDHLTLGASESVVVNGNVDGWRITGNHVHDDNNIGIDAIGYEPTLPAAYRYTDLNRARNGVISGNDVADIISEGNPAYYSDGSYCNCADGIYVDGGTHIDVAGNTLLRDDIGIEVAAENPQGTADHVTVRGNDVTAQPLRRHHDRRLLRRGTQDCGGVQTGASFANSFTGNRSRTTTPTTTDRRSSWCSTTSTTTRSPATRSAPPAAAPCCSARWRARTRA